MPAPPTVTLQRRPTARAAVALLTGLATLALLLGRVPVAAQPPGSTPEGDAPPGTDPGAPTTAPPVGPRSTTPAAAAGPRRVGEAPDGRPLPYLPDPRIEPQLTGVAVDTLAFRLALAHYRTTEDALAAARATIVNADRELGDLQQARATLTGDLNQSIRRLEKSDDRLTEIRVALRTLAVDDYIRGAQTTPLDLTLDPEAVTASRGEREVIRTVRGNQLAEERLHAEVVDAMSARVDTLTADLSGVEDRIASTTATRDGARADEVRLLAQLDLDAAAVRDTRLVGDVPGLGFSMVALNAYVRAANRMALEQPSCGIRWTLLAAVSRTEGHHGTFGGASVDADGNVAPPILGVPLDGNGVAAIGDSDGGALDGDPAVDRAVGPMQFIPSTWVRYARDGNDDGASDPQNLYDATATAAAYLCTAGPGLDTDDGMRRSLRRYNNSTDYIETVRSRALDLDLVILPAAGPTG